MSNNPLSVSVVIPTYNCGRYIKRALDSVLNQTYQDFEILIVDDGSSDNTKEILADLLNAKDCKIKYFYQENQGHVVARNKGISESKGDFIAFLDADDYWDLKKLDKQIAVFQKKPDIDLVHGNVYIFYEGKEGQPCIPDLSMDYNKYSYKELYEKLLFFQIDVRIQTVLMKKSVFTRIGGFDENLTRLGSEDREFFLRVFQSCKTYFVNEYLAYYMIRKDSYSKNAQVMQKGRVYLIEKAIKHSKNKRELRNKIYSSIYLRQSRNYFADRMYHMAILNLFFAVYYNVFNFSIYSLVFKFLKPKFVLLTSLLLNGLLLKGE